MTIEAEFAAGEYQILILSARESGGLETWLEGEIQDPEGAAEALAPYVRDKSKFFVAKVDIKKVKLDAQGVVQLSPLRFTFEANELRLPVRLGPAERGRQAGSDRLRAPPDVALRGRELPNMFIPTNLEVADGVRNNFPAFFAELFDATVEKMGRKVVVTEYAWQTTAAIRARRRRSRRSDLVDAGPRRLRGWPGPNRRRSTATRGS